MELQERVKTILLEAERQLAGLATEAGATRDYDMAASLLELAKRVKRLADEQGGQAGAVTSIRAVVSGGEANATSELSGGVKARRPKKGEYPKFAKDGDILIKIGWSKKDKSEYEHKSPRKVVAVLGQALSEAGAKGRKFNMEKVLPLHDSAEDVQLPDYQAYLCLAWLRAEGLVLQHGRQGYSLPKNGAFLGELDAAWERLPSRE